MGRAFQLRCRERGSGSAGIIKAFRFDLDRGVRNLEPMKEGQRHNFEEAWVGVAVRHEEMHGEGRFRRACGPDVEVVEAFHSGQRAQVGFNLT